MCDLCRPIGEGRLVFDSNREVYQVNCIQGFIRLDPNKATSVVGSKHIHH